MPSFGVAACRELILLGNILQTLDAVFCLDDIELWQRDRMIAKFARKQGFQ
jgi:hypothetical protein